MLSTLINQRKDSIEQFTKGGRLELAQKGSSRRFEIIEGYLPKPLGEDEITAPFKAAIAEMGSPTMKDMGAVMKNVMARFAARRASTANWSAKPSSGNCPGSSVTADKKTPPLAKAAKGGAPISGRGTSMSR